MDSDRLFIAQYQTALIKIARTVKITEIAVSWFFNLRMVREAHCQHAKYWRPH